MLTQLAMLARALPALYQHPDSTRCSTSLEDQVIHAPEKQGTLAAGQCCFQVVTQPLKLACIWRAGRKAQDSLHLTKPTPTHPTN